jgi:hypothetical protein
MDKQAYIIINLIFVQNNNLFKVFTIYDNVGLLLNQDHRRLF